MESIVLILSLAGIIFGADKLVSGSVEIAKRYRVSDFVIGAVIVGIGTSMPEFTVSFIGALQGNAEVAIGNVVGSNIFNILGILGLTALFFPIAVNRENRRFEIPFCIGVSVLLTALVFLSGSPVINRTDGIILLSAFAGFMWYSFHRDRKSNKDMQPAEQESESKATPMWLSALKIVGGLGMLIISCDIFVDDAVRIAGKLGLNDAFISITLIACGTSLPELAASIAAAFRKNTQLALGNILGSNIFNICLILGMSAQVRPLSSSSITPADYIVMTAAAVMPLILGAKGRISRIGGAILLISYALYNWSLLAHQLT